MLVRCPDCGGRISRQASHCPSCGSHIGFALTMARMRRMIRRWRLYSAVVVLFGLVIVAGDSLHIAVFRVYNIGVSILLLGLLGLLVALAHRE